MEQERESMLFCADVSSFLTAVPAGLLDLAQ